jgi:hypothetical protein
MSHDSYSSGWRLHSCSQTTSLRSSWSGSYASWKLHWHSACLHKSSVVVVFHIRRSLGCVVANLHMCRHQHTHKAPKHECAEPLPLAACRNRWAFRWGFSSSGAPGNMATSAFTAPACLPARMPGACCLPLDCLAAWLPTHLPTYPLRKQQSDHYHLVSWLNWLRVK